MFNKFQCSYRLTLAWEENGKLQQAIVQSPITIQFQVQKALFQSNNNAVITVKNMDEATRTAIYQDRLMFELSHKKTVVLEAGYGDRLTMVCLGWITECSTVRNGNDMITTIEVLDPDVLGQRCSVTFKAGTSFKEAYEYLTSQMPNLSIGECGELNGTFEVPTVFDGNAFVAVNKLTGGHTFIDNGVIHTLNDNETLSDYGAYLISSETGLLGTPKRRDAVLEIDMLFEPTLRVGQLVEIKSETQSQFNGQYKIAGISHNCLISGAEAGTRTTTIQVIYLDYITNSNVALTGNTQGSKPAVVKNNKVQPIDSKITADVISTYNYVKSNKGNMPATMINKIVSWKNMIGNSNENQDRVKELTKSQLANAQSIANRFLQFYETYLKRKNCKITITSGWRSKRLNNKTENASKTSLHLQGRAIDFQVSGISTDEAYNLAVKSGLFGETINERYKGSRWVHVAV